MLIITCIIIWLVVIIINNILNKISKSKIVFEKEKIHYKGRIIYKNEMYIRYFTFHVSFIDPILVIPKLQINFDETSLICYLSKKDVKKLEKMGFKIEKI